VVEHIPEPSQQTTLYWGFYANAARGKRHKAGEQEAAARPALAGEDAADTFTRQARLSRAMPEAAGPRARASCPRTTA
jgi:hypothetical protein